MTSIRDVRAFGRMLGARLVELRLAKKQNQEQCAAEAGLSKAYLSQIEAGKRLPSLPMLITIAESFGLEMRELMPRWRAGEPVKLGHEDAGAYATPELAASLEGANRTRKAFNSARALSDDARSRRGRPTR